MKILVTGANGFIGKNLVSELSNRGYSEVFAVTRETTRKQMEAYVTECQFVFHLAGVNRPRDNDEFFKGNYGFTRELIDLLRESNNLCPVLFTSSIQAERENGYGKSKRQAEKVLFDYSRETGAKVLVYRLPNVFGKWSKPNYNSVVSTFCYNIARGLDVVVHDPEVELCLCYIDDVIDEFIRALEGNPTVSGDLCRVPISYSVKLERLVELIRGFRGSRTDLSVPHTNELFCKKLYSSYLSYVPEDAFRYELTMHCDQRGSFTEFIKTPDRGQFSVNVTKPGIVRGNHWHRTKNEKFLVVSGTGVIRFRKIGSEAIIEYFVNGNKLEVVDIPVGYTHHIENTGDTDLITIMWANEYFNPDRPDTYYTEV